MSMVTPEEGEQIALPALRSNARMLSEISGVNLTVLCALLDGERTADPLIYEALDAAADRIRPGASIWDVLERPTDTPPAVTGVEDRVPSGHRVHRQVMAGELRRNDRVGYLPPDARPGQMYWLRVRQVARDEDRVGLYLTDRNDVTAWLPVGAAVRATRSINADA